MSHVCRATPPVTAADRSGNLSRRKRQPLPTTGNLCRTPGGDHDPGCRCAMPLRQPHPHSKTAAGNENESERFDTHVVSV